MPLIDMTPTKRMIVQTISIIGSTVAVLTWFSSNIDSKIQHATIGVYQPRYTQDNANKRMEEMESRFDQKIKDHSVDINLQIERLNNQIQILISMQQRLAESNAVVIAKLESHFENTNGASGVKKVKPPQ